MGDPSGPAVRPDCVSAEAESGTPEKVRGEKTMAKAEPAKDNGEAKVVSLLERIASALEFMAAQTGHVPTAPAQSAAETGQTDAANTDKASE
jgi:hypothetical protein